MHFLLCPFPEFYLWEKSRKVKHVKTDPTYISVTQITLLSVFSKFELITSTLILNKQYHIFGNSYRTLGYIKIIVLLLLNKAKGFK